MQSEYDRSRSYSYGGYSHSSATGNNMQLQPYYGGHGGGGGGGGGPARPPNDLRCYSASYAQTQMGNPYNNPAGGGGGRDMKLKKGKSMSGSKSWSLGDPEFQRKKRVASYKMYSVEGKVKGTFRKSIRWIKDRYTQVVYGWW